MHKVSALPGLTFQWEKQAINKSTRSVCCGRSPEQNWEQLWTQSLPSGLAQRCPQLRLEGASTPICPQTPRCALSWLLPPGILPFTSRSPDTFLEFHEVRSPPSGHTYAVISVTMFHGNLEPSLLAQ